MDTQVILDRLQRFLLKLDTGVFEEMRDDATATIPALIIAAVSCLLFGLGGWLWWWVQGYANLSAGGQIPDKTKIFLESWILGSIFAFALWLVWIGVAYVVLVNLFHYSADLTRMIRSCSLATIPLILGILLFIPGINLAVGIAALALFFLLMDIGIQVSLDAPPGHVIVSTFAGFVVFSIVLSVLVTKSDGLAPNVFLFRLPATAAADAASNTVSVPRTTIPRNFQIPTVTTR